MDAELFFKSLESVLDPIEGAEWARPRAEHSFVAAPGFGKDRLDDSEAHSSSCSTPAEKGLVRAAVLVPLYQAEYGPGMLLIRRTDKVATHRGDISFPGGAVEPGDRGPVETALREMSEELGIDPARVEVLGRLSTGVTAYTRFEVTPVVGRITYDPESVVPQPEEVAQVLWLPLRRFAEPGVMRVERAPGTGACRPIYFFDVEPGVVVWGLTARIVNELLYRLGMAPQESDE